MFNAPIVQINNKLRLCSEYKLCPSYLVPKPIDIIRKPYDKGDLLCIDGAYCWVQHFDPISNRHCICWSNWYMWRWLTLSDHDTVQLEDIQHECASTFVEAYQNRNKISVTIPPYDNSFYFDEIESECDDDITNTAHDIDVSNSANHTDANVSDFENFTQSVAKMRIDDYTNSKSRYKTPRQDLAQFGKCCVSGTDFTGRLLAPPKCTIQKSEPCRRQGGRHCWNHYFDVGYTKCNFCVAEIKLRNQTNDNVEFDWDSAEPFLMMNATDTVWIDKHHHHEVHSMFDVEYNL
eukprot:212686_1